MSIDTKFRRTESAYRRFERFVEIPMLVLSMAFIVLLVLPEVIDLSSGFVDLAVGMIWALFAGEVLVLAVLAPSARQMLKEHWLDILIVIVPFLRPFRLARLARVLRAGGLLGRSVSAISAVTQRKGMQVTGAVALALIAGSGLLVWIFERDAPGSTITSPEDGLWWAVVTATTVGYGDHAPVTGDGRALAVVLMLVGVGLVGVVSANIAAHLVERDREDEMTELRAQLDRIELAVGQRG